MNTKKHIPRKRFGQNFLVDQSIIDAIVAVVNPQPNEHLLEIGPGLGALTLLLLKKSQQLHVIELDRDLVDPLIQKCAKIGELIMHNRDALEFDFSKLDLPEHSLKVVGNLPYNISTPLLFHLLKHVNVIKEMYVMLQKEVVNRLIAVPGSSEYGRLAVMIQYHCKVDALLEVPPSSFRPAPQVDSGFARLLPHTKSPYAPVNQSAFSLIVKQAFAQRRKTLRNNFKNRLNASQIEACEVDPGARAETLDIAAFIRLSHAFESQNTH